MSRNELLRKELRPHGETSAKCQPCPFFGECGGIQPERSLFAEDCFDLTCCGSGDCDNVCPYKPDFPDRCQEVGGLRFDDLPLLRQEPVTLPRYVPLIHHGYSRGAALNWPVVALDTYQVFRLDKTGLYRSITDSGPSLREAFSLHPQTKIILRGTAKDPPLERYWAFRQRDDAPRQMAKLGVTLAVGPNYSHFLDVPRTDNLFNRKRQLICLAEMAEAGVNAVPHLNAVVPGDWAFWTGYLRGNTTVRHVAVEFQTGNRRRAEGEQAVERLARLRDDLGRALHPLVIGAAQFLSAIAGRFDQFTLIDSAPFMKGVKRRAFDLTRGRHPWAVALTADGEPIDHLIESNIAGYAAWVDRRSCPDNGRKGVVPNPQ